MATFVAVDLGATSGRVVNVRIGGSTIELEPIHRFPTNPKELDGQLVWDIDGILDQIRRGLVAAGGAGPVESIAVDSWAVDYGLLDAAGDRLGPVHAYRSSRTDGVMDAVCARVGRERIYRETGIQFLPFNTAYQLVAARETPEYEAARTLLMVPDLVNHALCGSTTNEVTNASTTQLLSSTTREWSDELVGLIGLRRDLLPRLHEPGVPLGALSGVHPSVDGIPVVATASHDTASAVVGVPLRDDRPGVYISCGTWALVGCERPRPATTDAAVAANVTNELGAGGTVRLLKNATGLWLLEECRRTWTARGEAVEVAALVAAAEHVPGGRSVVDPDDLRFAAPGDMPARIAEACRETGQPVPSTAAELARVILDSLALKWRTTVATIEAVSGTPAEVVHLVGGGSAIPLLQRLCASACERPVLVGPVEATVLGNAVVQAVAAGAVPSIAHARRLVERAIDVAEIRPMAMVDWDALSRRLPASGSVA